MNKEIKPNFIKMKNMKQSSFLGLMLVFMFCSCKNTISYYVSTDGNDGSIGSLEQPFATLNKAKEAARENKGKPVIIYLREGKYYLDSPIIFTPEDSRNQNAPLTIQPYDNENVFISGARKLTGLQWEEYKNNIVKAYINEELIFDQLFVNDELYHMARYPNYDPNATYYNGIAADAIEPERVKNWNNPEGGYVHALHRHEWGGYHWLIKEKNYKNELELEGGWQNNRLMGMHPERRFVENIFEELDDVNEWFYDNNESVLYLYPTSGIENKDLIVETPQLANLFEWRGDENQPVEYIHIIGLELTHTLRTFMKTREPLLRSDWAIYRGGAVLMEGARHSSIKKCYFNNVGGNAVFFSNYNRYNEVSGCHIAFAGGNGVCFVGDPKAVRSPSFEYNEFVPVEQLDKEPGPKTNNYPANCIVHDNLMYGLGRVEKQIAGVQISMSQDITVSHNTIYDLPRSGINISDGTWGGHIIEFNDVFNTVLETGDHGSFNSWGRDRYWHPNYDTLTEITVNYPELILLDAVKTTVIRNNRFRCDHGWDIDLDDGSSNYHIYNNLCLNGGLKLREGFHRIVENNILINNSFHPHVWFPKSEDEFERNIVTKEYFPIRINYWGEKIDYNVFPNELALNMAQANGTDSNSVFGTIEYVNPENGDFRVKEGSIAFSVGFKNFDMDNFGVLSPELKSLAKSVPLPKLINSVSNNEEIQEILGLKVKNITTLGERSAAGLSSESGVWVLEVGTESPFHNLLQPNDVILSVNKNPVDNISEIRKILDSEMNKLILVISRNQKELEVIVNKNPI